MLQEKCQLLEAKLQHERDRVDVETQLHDKLLQTLANAKEKTMTTVGDMLRDNEQLELRIKEVTARLKEADSERTRKLREADEKTDNVRKHFEKVIKGKLTSLGPSETNSLRLFSQVVHMRGANGWKHALLEERARKWRTFLGILAGSLRDLKKKRYCRVCLPSCQLSTSCPLVKQQEKFLALQKKMRQS